MSSSIPTKYGAKSKMREWLINIIRGKQGREADAACSETLVQIRAHRSNLERRREERESQARDSVSQVEAMNHAQ